MTPAMPDATKGSPLAGIEQMHGAAAAFLRAVASTYRREGGPEDDQAWDAEAFAMQLRSAADYLAGLGKVLEEIPKPLGEYHALDLSEYGRHCERFVARLRTYLTSPRETVGKENP